jgi:hypothetical protein
MTSSVRLSRSCRILLRGSHRGRHFRAPSPDAVGLRQCGPAYQPALPYPPHHPAPCVTTQAHRGSESTQSHAACDAVVFLSAELVWSPCSDGSRMRGVGVVYWLSTLVRYKFSSAHLTPCPTTSLGLGTGNTDASPRGSASPPHSVRGRSTPTANNHRPPPPPPPAAALSSHKEPVPRAKRRESPAPQLMTAASATRVPLAVNRSLHFSRPHAARC